MVLISSYNLFRSFREIIVFKLTHHHRKAMGLTLTGQIVASLFFVAAWFPLLSGALKPDFSNCKNKQIGPKVSTGNIVGPDYKLLGKSPPVRCQLWSITVPRGSNITIKFFYVNIPQHDDRCENFLDVGPKPLVRICESGIELAPYTSSHELVWVRFYFGQDFSSFPSGLSFRLQFMISGYGCGKDRFFCKSSSRLEMECFRNAQHCDGIKDCADGEDELNCPKKPKCGGYFEGPFGSLASSYKFADMEHSFQSKIDCNWTIHVPPGHVIQIRFVLFDLSPGPGVDYVIIYDGGNELHRVIGKYTALNPPPVLIKSTTNRVFVKFHADAERIVGRTYQGFNASFQQKGVCLLNQNKCDNEDDCYDKSDSCDGIWHCPRHGADEKGCHNCDEKFPCGTDHECYPESEHCNGVGVCLNNQDEMNCTPDVCNANNGTYLCDNYRCIYESWLCDGRDDCGDNSDELNCGVPSVRVILAAVVGSLVCALLLVIAIGCIIRLFAVRFHDHHYGPRYETPMSRLQAEFMRRQAPPPYTEAMRTSRPFSEFIAQIREAGRRLSRSASGSDAEALVPPAQNEENATSTGGRERREASTADQGSGASASAQAVQEIRPATWRNSDASDSNVSSDSSLILNHALPEPPPLSHGNEDEPDTANGETETSCIDLQSSNVDTVQWMRVEATDRGCGKSTASTTCSVENETRRDTDIKNSGDGTSSTISGGKCVQTGEADTDDETLIDPLGSDCDDILLSVPEECNSKTSDSNKTNTNTPEPCEDPSGACLPRTDGAECLDREAGLPETSDIC